MSTCLSLCIYIYIYTYKFDYTFRIWKTLHNKPEQPQSLPNKSICVHYARFSLEQIYPYDLGICPGKKTNARSVSSFFLAKQGFTHSFAFQLLVTTEREIPTCFLKLFDGIGSEHIPAKVI